MVGPIQINADVSARRVAAGACGARGVAVACQTFSVDALRPGGAHAIATAAVVRVPSGTHAGAATLREAMDGTGEARAELAPARLGRAGLRAPAAVVGVEQDVGTTTVAFLGRGVVARPADTASAHGRVRGADMAAGSAVAWIVVERDALSVADLVRTGSAGPLRAVARAFGTIVPAPSAVAGIPVGRRAHSVADLAGIERREHAHAFAAEALLERTADASARAAVQRIPGRIGATGSRMPGPISTADTPFTRLVAVTLDAHARNAAAAGTTDDAAISTARTVRLQVPADAVAAVRQAQGGTRHASARKARRLRL